MTRQHRWLTELGRTGNGVYVVDQDQRILTWNKAAERMLGYSAEEAIGRYCYEIVGGRHRSGELFCSPNCRVQQCVKRGAILQDFDLLTTTGRGERVWMTVSIIPLTAKDGPLVVHMVRRSKRRERSEAALHDILGTLKAYGLTPVPPADTDAPSARRAVTAEPSGVLSALSARELEVISLLSRGYSTDDISRELNISPLTARGHIRNMLKKTGFHSRTELVSAALRNGMV